MIRRNFVDLTEAERDLLARGFNYVNDRGLIDAHATTHDNFFANGIHWRPQFLPWHRYFLRKLELALQEFNASIMVPFWDWTQSNSQDLEAAPWAATFGGRDNVGGKFDTGWNYNRNGVGNWSRQFPPLPPIGQIVAELAEPAFSSYRQIEGFNSQRLGSHVHAHPWVGGTMSRGASPLDPLFYLHHCNLDRLWSIWQLNNPAVGQYDATTVIASDDRAPGAAIVLLNGKMPEAMVPWQNIGGFSGATPSEMLDHRSLGYFSPQSGYTYAQDANLEAAWRAEFGTDLKTHAEPLAAAEAELMG